MTARMNCFMASPPWSASILDVKNLDVVLYHSYSVSINSFFRKEKVKFATIIYLAQSARGQRRHGDTKILVNVPRWEALLGIGSGHPVSREKCHFSIGQTGIIHRK